jgi:ribosomal protein S27AE
MLFLAEMSKCVTRTCPRCGDFFGVVLGNQLPEVKAFPIRGRCTQCGYRIEWKLLVGDGSRHKQKKYGSLKHDPL